MVIKWDYDYKMTLVYQYNGSILQSITVTEEDDEEATRSYECDSNGNIVRYAQDDGSYTCYTYTKLRLSKADYALYQQQCHIGVVYLHKVHADPIAPEELLLMNVPF